MKRKKCYSIKQQKSHLNKMLQVSLPKKNSIKVIFFVKFQNKNLLYNLLAKYFKEKVIRIL